MRGPWNSPRKAEAVGLAGALALAAGAPGQLLDLKGGAGTSAVAGDGTAAIIDHLTSEISRLDDDRDRAAARAGGTLEPHAQRAFDLRIAARRRAADLLTLATTRGDSAAPQALVALTIIDRLDVFDAWAAAVEHETSDPGPPGDAALAFIAGESDVSTATDAGALDRWLGRTLGPRAQSLGPSPARNWDALVFHAGWLPEVDVCDDPTTLADLAARWSDPDRARPPGGPEHRLSEEAARAIAAIDRAPGQNPPTWADAPGVARIDRLIRSAGRVMDGLDPAPPRETADALGARFDTACRSLETDVPRTLAELERVAAVVAIVDDTARAMSTAPRAVTPETKGQVWKSLWAASTGTGREDEHRRESLRRALDALLPARLAPDESAIIREARPLLRRLRIEIERAERELWSSIARPSSRNPMDDPGIVGSLATVRRMTGALRGLGVFSHLLEAARGASKGRADVGPDKARQRLLALAKDLERPASRDGALTSLLELLEAADAFTPSDAERTLRVAPADNAWTAAAAGRIGDLLAAVDSARAAALLSWGEARPDAAAAIGRVRSLTNLVELVHAGSVGAQIARQASAGRAGVISRHPGVELSGAAAAALLLDLEAATGRLVPRSLDDPSRDASLTEVDKLYAADAAVRLFARLETAARAMDLADVDPAIELSGAPGPHPWLAEQREDLALICWNAQELAAAQARRDRDQIARRTAQINALATRVLESLDVTR
jgi:hypothetical protein